MKLIVQTPKLIIVIALACCTAEKKALEPGIGQRVTGKLKLAFEEKDLEKVPYLVNFGNLAPENASLTDGDIAVISGMR